MQRNVLEYLEHTAAVCGGKAAFIDERETVTFDQLLHRTRALGSYLAARVDGVGAPVAALVDRSAESVAALLGILCAGCCYVPIDRTMPAPRMRAILEQLRPRALLYGADGRDAAEAMADCCPALPLADGFAAAEDDCLLADRRRRVLDVDPVYILFTSGSTGTPKGIVVTHRGVIDLTDWLTGFCGYTGDDVFGSQAPLYFDLSVRDVYQTLKLGATCRIYPKKQFLLPLPLLRALDRDGVTALNWTASAFHTVAASGALEKCAPRALRIAALGGEALQARHVNAWRRAVPGLQVVNLYGPTEITVDCTGYRLERDFADGEPIPLGRACENMEVLLLDEQLRPVPPGQPGELCVRGAGLALGYFGDWEKTRAAFVQNPLRPDYPDRLYRTGDLAVERDGLLYFLSRQDGQIKHMGYRIELGEIEVALHAVDGVETAVCLFDEARDRLICVYAGAPDQDALARAMRATVPKYMVPNRYVHLEHLPVNANGKVDRKLLRDRYGHGAD